MNIYINFSYFALERDRKCLYDNVRIYDGRTDASRLLARYCGDNALPVAVRTSGNSMLVVFQSDSLTVSRGFNATWVALKPSKKSFLSNLFQYLFIHVFSIHVILFAIKVC